MCRQTRVTRGPCGMLTLSLQASLEQESSRGVLIGTPKLAMRIVSALLASTFTYSCSEPLKEDHD